MTASPLELAIYVFYFFWATLGIGLLLLHLELYFSNKFNLIPRYYLGSLILFTLSPIFFALGAAIKPLVTIANTLYVLAFVEFALGVWELNRPIGKRIFSGLLLAVFAYAIIFEYLRQLGPSFFVERVAITNLPAIAAVSITLWGVVKLNFQEKSRQLKVLQYALIALIIFLFIRLNHLLSNGASGVGSIYQEKENWILWVRVINGALIFLCTLTLHNYFFHKSWQAKELAGIENLKIKDLLSERDTLIASLIKANKTAAAGALSASVIHEISQPVNAIQLNLELLKLKFKNGDAAPEMVAEVIDSLASDNQRISRIIQSLRSIFTESERSAERVNLRDVFESIHEIIRPELRRRQIAFQINQFENVVINISSSEIHQVLLNLINNAIHALANCGSLLRHLRIEASKGSDTIRVSISDNGPGVAPQFIPQLFELLSTTKQSGMGLGLWLCKHIITRYNGKIHYEKSKDGGAAFIFELPRES